MNEKTLSQRLQLVASFLPEAACFADIGSDHAYLPCFVCLNDSQAIAVAGEVNEGPFQSAKRTVEELGLADKIEVRKGDGLSVLREDEVTEVTIAGMGGGLISHILEQGKDKLTSVNRIIAQPNVDANVVRKWFYENNYELTSERIIEEDGHIYEILVGDKGQNHSIYSEFYLESQFLFGPFLLLEKPQPFKRKWESEKEKKEYALEQMKKAKFPDWRKISHFEHEIKVIQEVLSNEQGYSSQ
ncbi:tRNA (adenine(22)-N(1))-methyltransferase [Aquibacillus kalidii]|uniref:tRNA (adenine(22)-N(1))-methyltransferase n=1 Tax=Aquibacillus kalidii TaxID=2762597 RepID=UPI0016469A88|nr:class I SAM-dependent methyltransferase [Aquibacillus kalidii]